MKRNDRYLYLAVLVAVALVGSAARAQDSTAMGNLPIAKVQKLADAGDPAAQNELGLRYRLGVDVDKDPTKAIPWYLKAARQGYAKAYLNLGAAYYNGDGVPVQDQDSCVWFILAADAGDPRGQEAVERSRTEKPAKLFAQCEVLTATAYLKGSLIPQDYGRAMQWYVKAANAGDGSACEKVAYLYDRGLGVPADKQESFKWLKRSADLGYGPAIYEVGRAYEIGDGVAPNLAEAKKLYEKASSYAVPQVFTALGNMYAEGRGVKPDRQKALAYYIVAANYGDPEGKKKADALIAEVSPKQLAAARADAVKLASESKSLLLTVRK